MNNLRDDEVNFVLKNVDYLDSEDFRKFLKQNFSKVLLSKISEDRFRKRVDVQNQSFNLYPRKFYDIIDYSLVSKLEINIFDDGGYLSVENNIIESWIRYAKKSPFKCYNLIKAFIIWKEDI
jgi:hypothetical protein